MSFRPENDGQKMLLQSVFRSLIQMGVKAKTHQLASTLSHSLSNRKNIK